ncbi:MAG: 3-hydroxyacyl-CoA dehydrogenase [Campylobacteraceae bacterium]|nr:3-hydroxyacyl-CoA dehydrogenase [Campylobacteraceae bacterium]
MHTNKKQIVAVLGCGVIGLSWVRAFLESNHDVQVWDPDIRIKDKLELLSKDFPKVNLSFFENVKDAVLNADFIQENAPESITIKQELYRNISDTIGENTILASSTSTLKASDFQMGLHYADRILVGHPFNPPHLLPLVEVVGGLQTSDKTITQAMEFYKSIGKKPIRLNIEKKGHLANRLQAAVWREAVDAVLSGQASVEDVDTAITAALGPRWAVMGPFETFHMGGGEGGLEHFLEHLGDAFEDLWDDANRPVVTSEFKQKLISEVTQSLKGQSNAELTNKRDEKLKAILSVIN